MVRFTQRWKHWARQLKTEVYAIYLAYRDPRVPWYARVFVACVVAYAFSPIDLIPDPIPILGYLDDLILIPPGIKLALLMIPTGVMAESREKAREIGYGPAPRALVWGGQRCGNQSAARAGFCLTCARIARILRCILLTACT